MHASHGAMESRVNDRMNRMESGLKARLDALDASLRSVEAQQARMDERMAQVQHALGLQAPPPNPSGAAEGEIDWHEARRMAPWHGPEVYEQPRPLAALRGLVQVAVFAREGDGRR